MRTTDKPRKDKVYGGGKKKQFKGKQKRIFKNFKKTTILKKM